MRLILLGACALALTGCSTLTGGGNSDVALKILGNLEHCKRTYTASIGMGGGGSLNIECPPKPWATTEPAE